MTRQYKIYTASLTTGDNKALCRIVQRGVITAIQWGVRGLAGAGVDFNAALELSLNSVSSFTTNDAPATVLGYATFEAAITSGSYSKNVLTAGLQNPVNVGDQIYLHCVTSGTAVASGFAYVQITVNS